MVLIAHAQHIPQIVSQSYRVALNTKFISKQIKCTLTLRFCLKTKKSTT